MRPLVTKYNKCICYDPSPTVQTAQIDLRTEYQWRCATVSEGLLEVSTCVSGEESNPYSLKWIPYQREVESIPEGSGVLTRRKRSPCSDLWDIRSDSSVHFKLRKLDDAIVLKHSFVDASILKDKLSLNKNQIITVIILIIISYCSCFSNPGWSSRRLRARRKEPEFQRTPWQ